MNSKKTRKVLITREAKPQIQRSVTVQNLYNEIRPYKTLSQEETTKLFHIYHNGNELEKKQALDKLCKHNMKLVMSVARDYCSTNDNLGDLFQEGNIGLLKAVEMFDETKGAPFHAYAIYWIRRYISLFKNATSAMVFQTNKIKTANVITKITSDLTHRFERTPTSDEVLDEYNNRYPDKKLVNAGDLVNIEYVFIDQIEPSDDTSQAFRGYLNYTNASSESNTCLNNIDAEYYKEMIKQLTSQLTPKEIKVVRMLYGLDTGIEKSISVISSEMDISKQRVSQLYSTAKKKMQQELKKLAHQNRFQKSTRASYILV